MDAYQRCVKLSPNFTLAVSRLAELRAMMANKDGTSHPPPMWEFDLVHVSEEPQAVDHDEEIKLNALNLDGERDKGGERKPDDEDTGEYGDGQDEDNNDDNENGNDGESKDEPVANK